jgi:hypothetical protein
MLLHYKDNLYGRRQHGKDLNLVPPEYKSKA